MAAIYYRENSGIGKLLKDFRGIAKNLQGCKFLGGILWIYFNIKKSMIKKQSRESCN